MARPSLTDEQVDAFRERAVGASMRLFVENGYDAFSLRTLARELGVSHATPYRYFESKAELFSIVRAESFRDFAAFLRERLGASRDPARRLRILAHGYLDFARQQPAAFRLAFELGQNEPQRSAVVDAAAAEAWSVLVLVVREAVTAGVLEGSPDALARTLWAGVHGVAALELAGRLRSGAQALALLESVSEALIAAHAPRSTPSTKPKTRPRKQRKT